MQAFGIKILELCKTSQLFHRSIIKKNISVQLIFKTIEYWQILLIDFKVNQLHILKYFLKKFFHVIP